MKNNKPYEFSEEQIEAAETQIVKQARRIEFYLTEYTIEILDLIGNSVANRNRDALSCSLLF